MDDIITFNKSLQQRLEEYREVFGDPPIPFTSLNKSWTFYLQFTVDAIGWQAVWKIPRLTCESLCIAFPSFVLVLVLEIDFENLEALVRVLAVKDDIMIPDIHRVQLIQLWVTKDQDKSIGLNLESTANSIDMLRFFYLYLMRPWDEEDDSSDWLSGHLENRLRLYYDLKNGSIPRACAEHIHSLLTQARSLANKRDFLRKKIHLEELDEDIYMDTFTKIYCELLEIQPHMDMAEHPLLRGHLVKKLTDMKPDDQRNESEIWIIYDQGTSNDYINFLEKVKEIYPTQTFRITDSLASKLVTCNAKKVHFILNESKHHVKTIGILEEGGELRGIGLRENIQLSSERDDIVLDFSIGHMIIENITIDCGKAQCGILVRSSKLSLINCKIIGDGKSSTAEGLIVLSGGEVDLDNCDISGFSEGIVGNSGSTIRMKNCSLSGVDVGMKVFEECEVHIENTRIENCREYGIVLETNQDISGGSIVGGFDILNDFPETEVIQLTGSSNNKGDALVNTRAKLKPVEDLFSNPDFDPTIIESSEDMDCNATVLVMNGEVVKS
nr:unnamed protein product [Callosobruchus chinensis]